MEAQLTSPDVRSYGAVLVGLPMLGISFNERLGWTHTVNTYDGADLYLLELDENGYRLDGEYRDFSTRAEMVRVRGDGESRELWLTIRESVHGPVVGENPEEAVALRVAGLDASQFPRQAWEMLVAQDLTSFEAALSRLQLPMFTTLYADRDGNILHVFNGRVPARESGDFEYWDGLVGGGSTSTLWTGIHDYQDLPRVLNPESGWLQNANDPPWTTTFPAALDPLAFPDYMAPKGMHFRAQRSAALLGQAEELSFDDMISLKHSTRVALADRLLDDLLPLARTRGSPVARNAADVLERWDRAADAESQGTVLFVAWVEELSRRSGGFDQIFQGNWDQERPLDTPDGFANPDIAVSALEAAAVAVQDRYGMLTAPFGDVYRIRRDDLDLPGNGFGDPLGVFRAAWYEDGRFGLKDLSGGDSYVAAIEFSDPVRASAVIGYGNASQSGSPHRTDQLRLFAGKELRPVWLERSDVEAHTEEREVF
jgi:acyl-homoserine-lactone acylase